MKNISFIPLLFVVACANVSHAATIVIPIDINEKQKINLKDVVIKVEGGKITKITDNDGFTTPTEGSNPNSKTVKFDGGNLGAGTKDSIIIETNNQNKNYKILKYSFTDGSSRTNSKGDDINSKVIYGGEFGATFNNVSIDPFQYGYFYQFERNASFSESPGFFEILFNSDLAPTSTGVMSNTFNSTMINADFEDFGSPTITGQDSMTEANLTGLAGVAPIDWTYDPIDRKMIANYFQDAFNVDDPSSILWFTHKDAPALGVISTGSDNANIKTIDGVTFFTNSVDAPSRISEPSILALFGLSLVGLGRSKRKKS